MPNSTANEASAPLRQAESLLAEGDADLAMAYFFVAGDNFAKLRKWERAGYCYYKAASCYELEGRYDKAASDYERAAEYYRKEKLSKRVLESERAAQAVKEKANSMEVASDA